MMLMPKIHFRFYEFEIDGKPLVLLEIGRAFRQPVQFQQQEYIRVGSVKKKLKDFPEKERELWRIFDQLPFEEQIAEEDCTPEETLKLLDYPAYFHLLDLPLPSNRDGILQALEADELIRRSETGRWNITKLGAVLFAKKLSDFRSVRRKAVRVIQYRGTSKIETIREQEGAKGYAAGFEGLMEYINTLVPRNEVIGQAIRQEVPMYPPLAVRELVANALIHQDFYITGAGPMVELFEDRIEISNPGSPLIQIKRFLDSPPRSRNESLASFMRRIGVCEERGTGIDKVVLQTEIFQLPPPSFEGIESSTRVILFAHRPLRKMEKHEKIWATYLHACLKYVSRDFMTNTSLRERFGISDNNSAIASRIIKDAITAGMIRPFDETTSRKYMKYVPFWA